MEIKRALLSVWNKDGIVELGQFLTDQNIEILSTGGTKKVLEDAGFNITSISFITGSGSVMDGPCTPPPSTSEIDNLSTTFGLCRSNLSSCLAFLANCYGPRPRIWHHEVIQ